MIRIYTLPYRLVYCLTVSFPLSYRQTKICWKMWRAYRYLIDPRFPPCPPRHSHGCGDGHREGVEPLNLYIWAVLQFICNQMYLTCRNHTIACRIDNLIEGVVLAGLSTLFAVVRIDCQLYSHFDKNRLNSTNIMQWIKKK